MAADQPHILLAEDTEVQRMMIAAWLKAAGYDVDEAPDGEEALRLLHTRPRMHDLVLSDIGMPRINGINLCKTIKSDPRTRHIPVILLTSLGHDQNHDAALEAGADEFVVKPPNEQDLMSRVGLALASAGQPHARTWRGPAFEALAAPVLVTDADGRYVDGNLALRRLLGYDDGAGTPTDAVIGQPESWAQAVPKAQAENGAWHGQLDMTKRDGDVVGMDARATTSLFAGQTLYVWLLEGAPKVAAASAAPPPGTVDRKDLIEAEMLHTLLGLRSGDSKELSVADDTRLVQFRAAVESAAAVGRIRRFVRKNAGGTVVGHSYLRSEVERSVLNHA